MTMKISLFGINHLNTMIRENKAEKKIMWLMNRRPYKTIYIINFEATIRKSTFGFIQRLAKSTNSLIMTIEKSWNVRIDIWNFWQKNLYFATAT